MVVRYRVIEDDGLVDEVLPEPPTPVRPARSAVGGASVVLDATVLGVVALIASLVLNTRASIWFDEGATASAARRSVPDLVAMAQTVDAVHAAYYAVLHPWIALTGVSAWTLRAPSALFIALATAGMVVIGRMLATQAALGSARRFGLVGGLVFVSLPVTSWAGTEARSTALAIALTVWLTVVLLRAQRSVGRPAVAWWALYAVLVCLTTAVFVYAVLVVLAHGLTLLLGGRGRAVCESWLAATVIGGLAVAPLALLASGQQGQISWIPPLSGDTLQLIAVQQWFRFSWGYALLAWTIVILVVVAGARRALAIRRVGWAAAAVGTWERPFPPLALGLCWLALPTIALLLLSAGESPTYLPRYVATSAPAVALLIALGLTAVRPRALAAAGLVALLALGGLDWWQERGTTVKEGSPYSQVAAVLRASGHRGDAIDYVRDSGGIWSSRTMTIAYPDAVRGMTDLTLRRSAVARDSLWESSVPLADRLDLLADTSRVWYLAEVGGTTGRRRGAAVPVPTTADWRSLTATGFAEQDAWQIGQAHLYLLTRPRP